MNDSADSSRKQNLNAISVVLAIVCTVVCLIDWFQVSGSEYGMFYGVFVDPPASGFAVHAPNYYQSINSWYCFISTCLIIYIIGKLLGRSLPAVIFRILVLCIATFPFMDMLMYKIAVAGLNSRREWLETSIYLDFACVLLMAAIVGIEIISHIRSTTGRLRLSRIIQ